jgi:hypothetical protein
MADKKTFANKDMVGTPRGYVKKKDVERVDREMTPILKGATAALGLMPVVGPAARAGMVAYRGAKAAKAVTKAKDAVKAGRRFAPAGAKEAPKAAPKAATKKSDGVNATLAGLGGATAIGYGASKMFPARKGETAGSYPARKPGGGPQARQGSSPASKRFPVESTKNAEARSTYTKNPTQRPYDASKSPAVAKPPVPKAKPAMDKSRLAGKSKTRIAFEKEFAKQRKAGKKEFTFKGKKYTTKLK